MAVFSNSFRTKRSVDIALVLCMIFALAVGVHFWIAHRLLVLRIAFPVQAQAVTFSTRCSNGAPQWLADVAQASIAGHAALSNQLAYVDPQGNAHSCVNGWEKALLKSSRITNTTRFRYASLTKLITADAVLQSVNEGLIELGQPIVDILGITAPFKDPRVADITVEMLLRHSGGFDRYSTPDPLFEHYDRPWCKYRVGALSEVVLDYPPGSKNSYSNVGYCILGEILERVSGLRYQELAERKYGLTSRGMMFVDGPYISDEASYDFRNSDFYGENYYKFFDFNALASSAGLSGAALPLASLLHELVNRNGLTLLSAPIPTNCEFEKHHACYGFAFYSYQEAGKGLRLNVQRGFLPGTSSAAVVDNYGGVAVILSSGSPLEHEAKTVLLTRLYESLDDHYTIP